MRARELMNLHNTGHQGINALFAKAHSADWDFERDVDWSLPVDLEDPLVSYDWVPFGRTPTFRALPDRAKTVATRRAIGRMLNILQVGEAVAQDVCAKIGLAVREDDYRNHAAAQAMDEARHHLAYRRFLGRMEGEIEDIDPGTEMMFDSVLALQDPLALIASEQFFLESLAMNIFEDIQNEATNPLLRQIIGLITRDESRHMGFGVLYVEQWMKSHAFEERVRFARRWLGQILMMVTDMPGPIMLAQLLRRLRAAGVRAVAEMAPVLLREQEEINARRLSDLIAGREVPHLLKSARRAGLLKPDVLEALGLQENPVLRGALSTAAAH